MIAKRLSWLLVLASWLFTGCGKQVILKEDASQLSTAMEGVVAQSRDFYQKKSSAKTEFIIYILANGENCVYGEHVELVIEHDKPIRCLADDEKPGNEVKAVPLPPNARKVALDLVSLPSDEVAFQAIGAIAQFQSTVARIVGNPEFDASSEFQALLSRLNSICARIEDLTGKETKKCTDDKSLPESLKEEAGVLATLIKLITTANEDRRDIAALKKSFDESGDNLTLALTAFLEKYKRTDLPLLRLLAERASFSNYVFNKKLKDIPRIDGNLDSELRYKLLMEHHAKLSNFVNSTKSPDPLTVSIEALIKNHQSFKDALLQDKLTDQQRSRIAKESFDQIKDWFVTMYKIFTIF